MLIIINNELFDHCFSTWKKIIVYNNKEFFIFFISLRHLILLDESFIRSIRFKCNFNGSWFVQCDYLNKTFIYIYIYIYIYIQDDCLHPRNRNRSYWTQYSIGLLVAKSFVVFFLFFFLLITNYYVWWDYRSHMSSLSYQGFDFHLLRCPLPRYVDRRKSLSGGTRGLTYANSRAGIWAR